MEIFDELRTCAWAILLAAREVVDSDVPEGAVTLHYKTTSQTVVVLDGVHIDGDVFYDEKQCWRVSQNLPETVRTILDLYLPVLGTHSQPSVVVGHLGQSVDAKIATVNGDAFYVTGEENRDHLHRMRALSHAVLVGAETVLSDDPQLNTRTVPGPSPIRVVIDPGRRVPSNAGILRDGAAPTWLIHADNVPGVMEEPSSPVRRILLPAIEGRLQMNDIVTALAERGVRRLFVEGGGVTVSNMLAQNCLDWLQLAVAPILVGTGRPAIQLPGVSAMQDALRPPFQLYRMGTDVLWNFDVRNVDIQNGLSGPSPQQPVGQMAIPFQRLV